VHVQHSLRIFLALCGTVRAGVHAPCLCRLQMSDSNPFTQSLVDPAPAASASGQSAPAQASAAPIVRTQGSGYGSLSGEEKVSSGSMSSSTPSNADSAYAARPDPEVDGPGKDYVPPKGNDEPSGPTGAEHDTKEQDGKGEPSPLLLSILRAAPNTAM
jgi:hypothetical protein